MTELKLRKRKPGAGRKPNDVPTKAIRLPLPLANKLLDLKRRNKLTSNYEGELGQFFIAKAISSKQIPFFESRIQAGLPSPADDLCEGTLDLNEYLIYNEGTTFFVRVTGESMKKVGIFPGDMLIVDKKITPTNGKIVIAGLNGELTVKRLEKNEDSLFLCSENDIYPDIQVSKDDEFSIWGVVTTVIHSLS